MSNIIDNVVLFQEAAHSLRPGLIKYMEDSYETIQWKTNNIPSKEEIFVEMEKLRLELLFNYLRSERNGLLFSSDWTQVSDAPVDQAAWAEYRQALRDLPANTTDPENPVWPTPPE